VNGTHDPVAGPEAGDSGPRFHDAAAELVAENGPFVQAALASLVDVEIRSADGGGLDADERVGRLDEAWIGNSFGTDDTRSVIGESSHEPIL
jgi:hypothetical protein